MCTCMCTPISVWTLQIGGRRERELRRSPSAARNRLRKSVGGPKIYLDDPLAPETSLVANLRHVQSRWRDSGADWISGGVHSCSIVLELEQWSLNGQWNSGWCMEFLSNISYETYLQRAWEIKVICCTGVFLMKKQVQVLGFNIFYRNLGTL